MKKKTLLIFLFSIFHVAIPLSLSAVTSTFEENLPTEITVNNRVLAKVNGKVISVLDVMKKMDLIFFRRYPDLSSSIIARYQYYMTSWQNTLEEMIDDELIIADAVEKKVEVSDGDVREELEDLFGPNVVLNIDKIGLTYEEAWDMLKKESTVRRMNSFMVRSKAGNQVHPKKVRELYNEFAKQNKAENTWRYQVLTIRSADEKRSNGVAEVAFKLLDEQKVPFEKIAETLKENGCLDKSVAINVSDMYERKDEDLSLAHKAVLQSLNMGNHSAPILQTTKNGDATIHRIFYLSEKIAGKAVTFNEMEEKLRKELTQKEINKESEKYLKKLRRHYGVTDKYLKKMIPDQFIPFSLE